MTKHTAIISVQIDFTSNPEEDPSTVADDIARDVSDVLQHRFGSLTAFLDDVIDQEGTR